MRTLLTLAPLPLHMPARRSFAPVRPLPAPAPVVSPVLGALAARILAALVSVLGAVVAHAVQAEARLQGQPAARSQVQVVTRDGRGRILTTRVVRPWTLTGNTGPIRLLGRGGHAAPRTTHHGGTMQTRFLDSVDAAFALFDRIGGDMFAAEFVKKDGTVRRMNARRGVKKHLKGGELAYAPRPRGLLSVYDMQSKGYRMVNVATLREVVHGGIRYVARYHGGA